MSKDFFKGDELAQEVWKSKYQLQNESIEEFFDRIIKVVTLLGGDVENVF